MRSMTCSVWTTSNANTCFRMRTSEKQKDIITSHAYFCGKIPRAHILKGVDGYSNRGWMRILTQLTRSMITKGADGYSNTMRIFVARLREHRFVENSAPQRTWMMRALQHHNAHIDNACSAAPQCAKAKSTCIHADVCRPNCIWARGLMSAAR